MTVSLDKPLDFDARYSVDGYSGVAFYLTGYGATDVSVQAYFYCSGEGDIHEDDLDACNGHLGDTGEWEQEEDRERVRAVMVGDDTEHLVEVSSLTKLADDAYCGGCGQVGCEWG